MTTKTSLRPHYDLNSVQIKRTVEAFLVPKGMFVTRNSPIRLSLTLLCLLFAAHSAKSFLKKQAAATEKVNNAHHKNLCTAANMVLPKQNNQGTT
jgi:hypothetical protein